MSNKKPTDKQIVERAIRCGPKPSFRTLYNYRKKKPKNLSRGEKVCRFAEQYLKVPEGNLVGQPLKLDVFQVQFILAVFDNPNITRKAILSIGRRSGKTFCIAVILLAFVIGPEAVENTLVCSAALSRDQAAITFRLMNLMLMASPELDGLWRSVPSSKQIIGLRKNVTYQALSADARKGQGRGIYALLLDESGQIVEPENDYLAMLVSSQGNYDDAMMFIVSTQAPSDQSYLSTEIDNAAREGNPKTVCHVYEMDPEADIDNEYEWYFAQPSLGKYRSLVDMREQVKAAIQLPAKMPGVQNLLMNMRVSLDTLFINGILWKENSKQPDYEVFRRAKLVSCGLDLSMVNDLTSAVLTCEDEMTGEIHALTYAFSPADGIKERSDRDKVPYFAWAKDGTIYAPPGATLNYDMICEYLKLDLEEKGITINQIHFDRWSIHIFKSAAQRTGFATGAEFIECGQGYKSMGPRVSGIETILLERRLRHGMNPVLTLGAASAIVTRDPAGSRKLDKSKSAQKIDGLVALVMSIWPFIRKEEEKVIDISALVG